MSHSQYFQDSYDAGYLYECEFDENQGADGIHPEDKEYEPIRSIPVDETRDVPISVLTFRFSHTFHFGS